jgi:hypothetical protein
MREWTLTLPRQLPLWDMESQWTSKTSGSNFKGQNSMACGILYIIGKLLECRCLKWARIAHLDIWNTSYGPQKGRESNCQLTPDQTKSRIDSIYLAVEGVQHTIGKLSTRATTLLQTAFQSEVCSQRYGVPKSRESHLVRFRDSHLGVSEKKSHLDVGSVASHRVYYKGEGGGLPQVRAVVSLMYLCCPWLVLAPRVLQLCTNHFVWITYRLVWVSEACKLFLVPSWNSNTPLYPAKCCELKSVPRLLPLPLSSTWTHIWVFQRVESASFAIL